MTPDHDKDATLAVVSHQIGELNATMESGFRDLHQRVGGIETRVGAVERKQIADDAAAKATAELREHLIDTQRHRTTITVNHRLIGATLLASVVGGAVVDGLRHAFGG